MAKNNAALKKHHFWILLGLIPLLVLIAVFTVTSSVGGAISQKVDDYDKAQKEIASKTNPKPKALLEELDKQIAKVSARKGDLWKLNWDRQKDMYVWPNSQLLKEIEGKQLKFGDKIPNNADQYEEFKKPEVYLAEFSTADIKDKGKLAPGAQGMVETITPTQFRGGWKAVLRHINAWDDRLLTSEQIWLMMEDIWVQRSMLDAVRSVNAQMSEFKRVKFEKDGVVVDDPEKKSVEDPLRRKFKSRTWEVELEVVNKDNRRVLTGRLINHTDRLQLMGLGNTMTLKVWLEPGKDIPPFEFKIGGEFLPGRGVLKADGKSPANVLDIVQTDDHIISPTTGVSEIVKVEQVFDTRTVPIRRIEAMALGFADSRFVGSQLKMPEFKVFKDEAAAAASAATMTPTDGSMPPGGMPVVIPRDPRDPSGGAGTPGTGGVASTKSGGGTVDVAINGNRDRYVEVTNEVRRMPVGIVVIVDQVYMQDVLLAFANSPLRFQITQVNWARFRDRLDGLGTGSGGPGEGPLVVGSGSGVQGEGFGRGGGEDERGGLRPLTPGTGGAGGLRPRPPGGVPGPGPGVTQPPPGGSPMEPGGMPYDPYGTGIPTTVSESQLTSGLIELSIYGVVSLYEKYTPPGETPADTTAKDKDTPKEPKDTPKDKGSKDPMVPDPKTPKMRRRVR